MNARAIRVDALKDVQLKPALANEPGHTLAVPVGTGYCGVQRKRT